MLTGVLSGFRALRVMRPLRSIERSPSLKLVVNAILACLHHMVWVSLIGLFSYLVFAIIGVNLWAGKFWFCNDTSVSYVTECTGDFVVDSVNVTRVWTNPDATFDNIGEAMLSLTEAASLELWLDIMYNAMDAPAEIGQQPTTNNSWPAAFYFVLFLLIGSFLIMNMFIGAVVITFAEVITTAPTYL